MQNALRVGKEREKVGEPAYAVGYFEPQERRTQQISVRVPTSVKDGLARLAKLWTQIERLRSGDAEVEVTESDVVNRLLELGLDGAWAEIGSEPKTEADFQDLAKRAEKALSELRSESRKK